MQKILIVYCKILSFYDVWIWRRFVAIVVVVIAIAAVDIFADVVSKVVFFCNFNNLPGNYFGLSLILSLYFTNVKVYVTLTLKSKKKEMCIVQIPVKYLILNTMFSIEERRGRRIWRRNYRKQKKK